MELKIRFYKINLKIEKNTGGCGMDWDVDNSTDLDKKFRVTAKIH